MTRFYLKKIKQIYQKRGKPFIKSKRTPCSLKHKGVLLFNPVKIAETLNFFLTNIGPNIANRIRKGRKSPMTYLNDKILKSSFFYPTTPDEIIKITKSFSNNK